MDDFSLIKHRRPAGEDPQEEPDEDGLYDHYTLRAAAGQKPVRLDKFITNFLPFTSRSKIKNAFQTGSITVNGRASKPAYQVRPLDEIKVMLPWPPHPELAPEPIPLDIRYEDEALVVLHKPAGMVCHPSLGHRSGTLVHALLWHFQELPAPASPSEFPRPGLVHRIDKDTTGIIVVAKQEYAMAHLSRQFFERSSDRRYMSLVWGDLKEDRGTIEAHVGRNPADRKTFAVVPESESSKHAITHYEVLERFGVATLIACKLETGRTHQIRVHLKHMGHPLFGDADYGGDKILRGPNTQKYRQMIQNCLEILPRQALHAKSLSFEHPMTGAWMQFDSELPDDMQQVIGKLRAWQGQGE
jgi:23S rRNA pseudouridine1911/1915/1917 synthase